MHGSGLSTGVVGDIPPDLNDLLLNTAGIEILLPALRLHVVKPHKLQRHKKTQKKPQ